MGILFLPRITITLMKYALIIDIRRKINNTELFLVVMEFQEILNSCTLWYEDFLELLNVWNIKIIQLKVK